MWMAGAFANKVGIVTGAGSGIGEAIAHELAREGATVIVAGMKHQIAAMLELGGGAIVNMSKILGSVGFANASAYVASKHAVNGWRRWQRWSTPRRTSA